MFAELDADYVKAKYPHTDSAGRRYGLWDMTGPGGAAKGNPQYPVMGVIRYWRYSRERMERLIADGKVVQPKPGGVPREKRYLDESLGVAIGDVWTDIPPINSQAQERLGYPTQKPLALLERIIEASSNEGDVILDPFCGCGTAVHAAQKLKRQWVGIDITHLAVAIVEKRLRDAFPGIKFEIHGTPTDTEGARDLAERDKYEFQYWACSLVNAQPYQQKKKGADTGIDGLIYFQDDAGVPKKVVVSVKGGQNVSAQMVRDLRGVVEREKAAIGLFVTLIDATKPMRDEAVKAGYYDSPIGSSFPRIQILTIDGLLTENEQAKYPDLYRGGHTFKSTPVDQGSSEQQDLFASAPRRAERDVASLKSYLRVDARTASSKPALRARGRTKDKAQLGRTNGRR